MCNEFLMKLYSPLESLTTDEYNALMAEMAQDNDEPENDDDADE